MSGSNGSAVYEVAGDVDNDGSSRLLDARAEFLSEATLCMALGQIMVNAHLGNLLFSVF